MSEYDGKTCEHGIPFVAPCAECKVVCERDINFVSRVLHHLQLTSGESRV